MRRTLLPAAAVLLLAGCSSSGTQVNTTPLNLPSTLTPGVKIDTSSPAKQAPPATTPSSAAKAAKVGDTVDLKDDDEHIQITLVKVVDPAKPTDEYRTPKADHRFIAVQVRIVNAGTKPYSGDPMARTTAKDASDQQFEADYSPAETAVGQPMSSGVTLAPGEKVLGVMTFEVPAGVKLVSMQYSTHGFTRSVAQWALS